MIKWRTVSSNDMSRALAVGVVMLSLGILTVMRIASPAVPTSTQKATATNQAPLPTVP